MSLVNVLCAPPNGRNPGMASVDLALESVARQLDAEVVPWRLWDQSEWVEPPGGSCAAQAGFVDETTGMTYQPLRGRLEEFLDADAILYWGDFLHMAVYQRDTADVLHNRMRVMGLDEARAVAASTLLLDGQPDEVLSRTVSFGTTLAFNSSEDYGDAYGDQLHSFVSRAHGAWFRDGYSARVAELMRAPRTTSALGADAAFLTDGPTHTGRGGTLGVFFGRSAIAPERVARLGRELCRATGLEPRWLSWGTYPAMWPMRGRKRLRLAWPELEGSDPALRLQLRHAAGIARGQDIPEEHRTAAELFREIAEHRLILTDTYHLAINAWRIGTPALLVADQPSGEWSVNSGDPSGARDKRHDLYSQLDALPYLVSTAALPRSTALSGLAELLMDEEAADRVRRRATAIADHARTRVVQSLQQIL